MTPEEITEELKKQAEIQQQVSRSIDDYVEGMRQYKKTLSEINKNKQRELLLEKEIASATGDAKILAETKLKILKEQTAEMEEQAKIMGNALASVNKKSLAGAKLLGEAALGLKKAFLGLPNIVKGLYGELKSSGLFEMEKEIKKSALSMGILSKQSNDFRGTIVNAAKQTTMIGVGVKELSQMQSAYSEELGRSVVLSKEGLIAMGELAAATNLGAEGAAKLSADMELQGLSAERTGKYVEQTLNDSHKMGVNATKVLKNISNNTKMLNRYNFKDGVKGLAKMAQTVSKLGVDMEFAAGFADKLWNVEGAVDMSAQLSVMGGAWAKMSDPFHLMYMARNDMEGLTAEIADAAKESVSFNKETGEFQIAAKEMHRLKIIAEQTGMSYDELTTAAKNAAKFSRIKGQVQFSLNKEEQEFLTNTAKLDENGKAYIEVRGEKKYMNQLTQADRDYLKQQIEEKATMKERAEQAITFDEQFTFLINQLKVNLLPLVKTMNDNLIPKLKELSGKFTEKGGWGEKLEELAETVGSWVSSIAGWMIELPRLTAGLYLFSKAAPTIGKIAEFFWDKIKWFSNGVELGLGFNSVASAGGGGGGGGAADILSSLTGGKGTTSRRGLIKMFGNGRVSKGLYGAGKSLGRFGKFMGGPGGAGVLAAATEGFSEWSENSEMGMGTGENIARTASKSAGAGLGAWYGATAGASIGALGGPLAPITVPLGMFIGGLVGGWGGGKLVEAASDAIYGDEARGMNDGLFTAPIHDGLLSSANMAGAAIGGAMLGPIGSLAGAMFGSEFSKGRGVIQNGKITPIDNKDDLLAMKPGGAIDKATTSQGSTVVRHTFDTINLTGEIKLTTPGDPGKAVDLMRNPQFIRDITRTIQSQLEKNINGGKNKG